ncbi:MAG: hypothetical protein ACFB16_23430 [Phormidesmis sp.]
MPAITPQKTKTYKNQSAESKIDFSKDEVVSASRRPQAKENVFLKEGIENRTVENVNTAISEGKIDDQEATSQKEGNKAHKSNLRQQMVQPADYWRRNCCKPHRI